MKSSALIKLNWLDRAVQTHNFHVQNQKDEPQWTIEKTAKVLNRSIGSISQDLTIASWYRTHEKQLRRFSSMRDGLDWIKRKRQEMNGEIES